MPRPYLTGLRGRLFLLIILAALPAFALTIYTGWEERQRRREGVASETVTLARIVASDQERLLDGTRQILSDLADIPEVRAGDTARCRTFFALLMKQYRGYSSFSVIDPAGNLLASLPPIGRPVNFSDRPWFSRAVETQDFTLGEYQVGVLSGKQVVVAAWPARDESGRLVSVIAAGLDVAWLNQIAATAQLPAGAVLVLVDRRGAVVAHHPDAPDALGHPIGESPLADLMGRQSEGTIEVTSADATTRIYAFTPVRGRVATGLRLAIGVPSDVAYGPIDQSQRRHLLVLLLVMVLTLGASWFGAEQFVLRPVSWLIQATRQLAAGDPAARTRLPYGQGELGDLARSFDEMAAALQTRQVERDRAEQALRASEDRFRAFMDNSPAIAFMREPGGPLVYANATLERYFGLGPGDWLGATDGRFWADESARRFRRDDEEACATGRPRQSVDAVALADGRVRHWLTVQFPVARADGGPLAATLAFDLTEWRAAQEALARAERRYSELVEQATVGIVITDPGLRLIAVNPAVCVLSGYDREELVGMRLEHLLGVEEADQGSPGLAGLRAGDALTSERRLRRKDGSTLFAEMSVQGLDDGGVQAFLRDVTGRHEAEEALRASEERFRLLYQYLPLAYHTVDERGALVLVNDAWLALTRFTRAAVLGRRFADLLEPASVPVYEEEFAAAIPAADVHDVEVTLVRGDGTPVTVLLDGRRGRDERGELRIHCGLHDVTEARRADARLRESEERYRTLFADSPVSLWEEDFSGIKRHIDRLRALGVTDIGEHLATHPDELADCVEAVRVIDVNRATLALYGADSRSQLLAGLDRVIGPDGWEVFRRSIVALSRGERSWRSEGINHTVHGDAIRVALQWSVAPGAEDTWARVLVSAIDITDRASAEDALRESEARFEQVFRAAPVLVGVSRLADGMYLDVNDAFVRELGCRREEVIGRTSSELDLWVDPATRAEMLQAVEARGSVRNLEVSVRRRSGGVLNGLLSATPIRMWGEDCLLVHVVDVTAARRAEQAGRESERVLTTLMSNLPGMAYQCCADPEWTMLFVSDGCRGVTGYEPADLVGNRRLSYGSLIAEEDREGVAAEVRDAIEARRPFRLTYRIRHADGSTRWVYEQGRPTQAAADAALTLEGFIADITDRKRAEEELIQSTEQLRQAHKMEAIGRLAGGIAHDFNNLLTAILGYSDLVLNRLASDDPLAGRVEEIRRAGERAANLTRKLLAFSRKQVLEPSVVVLDAVLEEMAPMLRRLIGEDIELRLASGYSGNVRVDPTQLEQVVMNLVVNARDAMPRGGALTLGTGTLDLDDREARDRGVAPGLYAVLSIRDTGVGMDERTRTHLFEPFFTTKPRGQGTGLGLSTVYGLVQQSGGFIAVDTELGKGTTFRIGLPRVDGPPRDVSPAAPAAEATAGTETILVAEDEEAVRRLIRAILERFGYTVLDAVDGQHALGVWREHADQIDLIVTDVVMPHMDGPSLVARVRASAPEMPVVFLSGYTDEAILSRGALAPGTPILQKPFTSGALARAVRAALDGPSV